MLTDEQQRGCGDCKAEKKLRLRHREERNFADLGSGGAEGLCCARSRGVRPRRYSCGTVVRGVSVLGLALGSRWVYSSQFNQ